MLKQYLETLDPGSYFLQSDIDEFNQQAFQLHKQLRKGDIHLQPTPTRSVGTDGRSADFTEHCSKRL